MEVIGLVASIGALADITAKVIKHSQRLIHDIKTAPRELYLIHIETTTLGGILNSLQSLSDAGGIPQHSLDSLQGWNGLIGICHRTLVNLDKILDDADTNVPDKVQNGILRAFDRLVTAEKASRAKKLIDDVRRFTDLIKMAMLTDFQYQLGQQTQSINALTRGLADVQTVLEVRQLEDLLHWISPLNVSYRQSYLNARQARHGGTGNWLLEAPQYREWRDQDQDAGLSVTGRAGSGKTILSAVVLDDLLQRSCRDGLLLPDVDNDDHIACCVLYYYFDLRDAYKNTTAGLYDALARQLLHHHPLGYTEVWNLAKLTNRAHPSPDEYVELICVLITDILAASNVFLVIDGFDPEECNNFDTLLAAVARWKGVASRQPKSEGARLNGRLKMLLTSREYSRVRKFCETSIVVEKDLVMRDIKRYVEGRIGTMSDAARKAMGGELLLKLIDTVVSRSDGLFIQAKLHCDTVTQTETVADVLRGIEDLPGKQADTYAKLLRDILTRYPGPDNRAILRRMFLWLCEAKYCLSVAEFVAVTTLELTAGDMVTDNSAPTVAGRISRAIVDRRTIPWDAETFCLRLGPFLNIDRRPSPPEINLPHATMEEFFLGPFRDLDDLRDFRISSRLAQRELSAFCIRLIGGYPELDEPLLTFLPCVSTDNAAEDEQKACKNPFKEIPGGLGVTLDRKKHPAIDAMLGRLETCPGLEYAAINWHHHLRNAISDRPREDIIAWLREDIVPLLDQWFLNGGKRFRSWQEVHGFFCHELEEDCGCGVLRSPAYFLEKFRLGELLSYDVDGSGEHGATFAFVRSKSCEGAQLEPETKECTDCGRENNPATDGPSPTIGAVVGTSGRQPCQACSRADLKPESRCGRSFKLFQKPGLKWRAMMALRLYGVDQALPEHTTSPHGRYAA